MYRTHTRILKSIQSKLARQEAQQQPGVVAVATGETHGLCITATRATGLLFRTQLL